MNSQALFSLKNNKKIEFCTLRFNLLIPFFSSVDSIGVLAEQNLRYRLIESGAMIWEPPSYFEVYCDMDLKFFPFDKHTCGVTLSSWSMDQSEMPVKMLDTSVNLALYQ